MFYADNFIDRNDGIYPIQMLSFPGFLTEVALNPVLKPLHLADCIRRRTNNAFIERRNLRLLKFVQLIKLDLRTAFLFTNFLLCITLQSDCAHFQLFLEALDCAAARVFVHFGDDKLREVEHALQMAGADVEQPAPGGWERLSHTRYG